MLPPKEEWKKCVLCGKVVHPWQEESAEPLAVGIACVSCSISRVYATRVNGGIPSHRITEKDRDGKWYTSIVADDPKIRKNQSKEGKKKNGKV